MTKEPTKDKINTIFNNFTFVNGFMVTKNFTVVIECVFSLKKMK